MVGSRGTEVLELQKLLIRLGYLGPAYTTGYFGPRTFGAVLTFQEDYAEEILAPAGLENGTGIVGPRTREKLNQISRGF